jgi:hypothetical protein
LIVILRQLGAPKAKPQPVKQKPERAYMCRHYNFCLDLCAFYDWKKLPCKDCKERQDVPAYDLRDDPLNCVILAIAVLYPEIWQRSLYWQIRQMCFFD